MAVQGSLNATGGVKKPHRYRAARTRARSRKGKKQKGQEAIDLVSGAFFFSFFLAEGPDIWPWPWRSMPGDWRATSERSK